MRSPIALLFLLAIGCASAPPQSELIEGEAGGVAFRVRLGKKLPESERAEVERMVGSALEAVFTGANQDLSRLSRAEAGEEIPVSAETFEMVREAVRVSELTQGAFDITVPPLARLWGFGAEGSLISVAPTEEQIAAARERVGFRNLELDDDSIAITNRVSGGELDLGGMIRGNGIDRAAAVLEERGYRDYLIEAGAEVATNGKDAAGEPWKVAIRRPGPGEGEIQRSIPLSGFSMATSVDYRGSETAENLAGKLHAHLVDPRSGRPLDHRLLTVAVLGDSCMTASALAAGLLVLGPDEGFRLAAAEDLPALFLIRHESGGLEERATPAFAELFF
jgi:thiamine biosynthesis lipoprotein